MKLTLLAAIAALSFSAFGQTSNAAKPAPAVPVVTAPAAAPQLNTATLWRLLSQSQSLRQQLEATEQGKSLKEVEAKLQAEQNKLAATCGPNFVLGYQQDTKAENFQDVICSPKPPETAKPAPPKEK